MYTEASLDTPNYTKCKAHIQHMKCSIFRLHYITMVFATCTVSTPLAHLLPYSVKISRGLTFVFLAIMAKSRKFICEIFSFAKFLLYVYCSIITGFTCDHGPVEVFSVHSRSLPDPKCPLSSTVRPQAIDSAN